MMLCTQERTEGTCKRQKWNGIESQEDRGERESAEEKDAGGLHASLEPSSGAVAFKYSLRPFCLQLSHTVTFAY